ncbi:MAG: 3-deoxy-manno-octulosonate cytidylyltransferase [Acidobacteria bacterium]|nr:3-deoxy-manno-octulosonate cytidylyltransferase [Acidobacteriota bacterium]
MNPPPAGLRIVAGIPARYGSTRFPGKPLALLAGKPLIEHVYRRAALVAEISQVIVATDDARIVAAVKAFGGEARLTSASHRSGTDRLAEVFAAVECDVVVNVQGDEPLIHPDAIRQALEPFLLDAQLQVSTLKTRIRELETLTSPHAVKVVTDAAGYALSFSRAPDPPVGPGMAVDLERLAYYKHLGLYAYRRAFLLEFARWPASPREEAEKLEQWRMLDHGARIRVVETPHDSIGVDTQQDLARAEELLARS